MSASIREISVASFACFCSVGIEAPPVKVLVHQGLRPFDKATASRSMMCIPLLSSRTNPPSAGSMPWSGCTRDQLFQRRTRMGLDRCGGPCTAAAPQWGAAATSAAATFLDHLHWLPFTDSIAKLCMNWCARRGVGGEAGAERSAATRSPRHRIRLEWHAMTEKEVSCTSRWPGRVLRSTDRGRAGGRHGKPRSVTARAVSPRSPGSPTRARGVRAQRPGSSPQRWVSRATGEAAESRCRCIRPR